MRELAVTTSEVTRQALSEIDVPTNGVGLVDITDRVRGFVRESGVAAGLLTVFVRHTSASLLIQENADPDVQVDLDRFFARLAPWDTTLYRHATEGPDDMPAHIRSALTQTSLAIPIAGGRPVLGTWQGIYLYEHREHPHRRHIVLHLIGA
ncbi:MAG: secondary thiamine-phosphate synthase enzyme YjbQ [Thalassobaculaceae bacterium]|nr:secondary thiamine-phosphate synthase enzyme YjbQ [Thalassobaculaceae bacterium]